MAADVETRRGADNRHDGVRSPRGENREWRTEHGRGQKADVTGVRDCVLRGLDRAGKAGISAKRNDEIGIIPRLLQSGKRGTVADFDRQCAASGRGTRPAELRCPLRSG